MLCFREKESQNTQHSLGTTGKTAPAGVRAAGRCDGERGAALWIRSDPHAVLQVKSPDRGLRRHREGRRGCNFGRQAQGEQEN